MGLRGLLAPLVFALRLSLLLLLLPKLSAWSGPLAFVRGNSLDWVKGDGACRNNGGSSSSLRRRVLPPQLLQLRGGHRPTGSSTSRRESEAGREETKGAAAAALTAIGSHGGKEGLSPTKNNAVSRREMNVAYVITAVTFAAGFIVYLERQGFSVAFTAMAKAAQLEEDKKGAVLSAYFYGYTLSQIPGGWLTERIGASPVVLASFVGWAVISLLTPTSVAAEAGFKSVMACRVLMGVTQGLVFPALHHILGRTIPTSARTGLVSLGSSGMFVGSAVALTLVPALVLRAGAGAPLRLVGLLGLGWAAIWLAVDRILKPLQQQQQQEEEEERSPLLLSSSSLNEGSARTPWVRMLMDPAVWAHIAGNFSHAYTLFVLMSWLPTYFETFLGTSLAAMGKGVTALPYVAMFLTTNGGGLVGQWVSDFRLRRGLDSPQAPPIFSRKVCNTLGFLLAAVGVAMMPSARSVSQGLALTTLSLSGLGLSRSGWALNHIDIAPKHAGALMSLSNTAAAFAGGAATAFTGSILDAYGGASVAQGWTVAFGVNAAILLVAAAWFLKLGRADVIFE